MKIRLAIRGYQYVDDPTGMPIDTLVKAVLRFEERTEVDPEQIDDVMPALAEKHARLLASGGLHMIEIEFLDEPDPLQRFFRIGTDPRGMVMPIKVELDD